MWILMHHDKLGIVRFMLDGENINPDTTPADMDCKFNISLRVLCIRFI